MVTCEFVFVRVEKNLKYFPDSPYSCTVLKLILGFYFGQFPGLFYSSKLFVFVYSRRISSSKFEDLSPGVIIVIELKHFIDHKSKRIHLYFIRLNC